VPNTTAESEASELIYQGPLIGMRSTRPKPTNNPPANPSDKKPVTSETTFSRRIG
jgi:hypothetical protein